MRNSFAALDRTLAELSAVQVLAVAACGVAVVGLLDYLTGYEVSISVFYLLPVGLAAWYAGPRASAGISVLACASWFVADVAAGQPYAHFAIEIWNSLVRLTFFVVNGWLMSALRESLLNERRLARTDALTGVFGRRAFEERLEHDLSLARRRRSSVTIAYVDVDNFKALNDSHGHSEGDRVLRAMGRALKQATRRGDTVARLGGDEFALVLPDTDQRGAEEVLSKLRQDLSRALASGASACSCSIGAVTFQDAPRSVEEALNAADALMYDAKRQGKDAVAFKVVTASSGTAPSERASGV